MEKKGDDKDKTPSPIRPRPRSTQPTIASPGGLGLPPPPSRRQSDPLTSGIQSPSKIHPRFRSLDEPSTTQSSGHIPLPSISGTQEPDSGKSEDSNLPETSGLSMKGNEDSLDASTLPSKDLSKSTGEGSSAAIASTPQDLPKPGSSKDPETDPENSHAVLEAKRSSDPSPIPGASGEQPSGGLKHAILLNERFAGSLNLIVTGIKNCFRAVRKRKMKREESEDALVVGEEQEFERPQQAPPPEKKAKSRPFPQKPSSRHWAEDQTIDMDEVEAVCKPVPNDPCDSPSEFTLSSGSSSVKTGQSTHFPFFTVEDEDMEEIPQERNPEKVEWKLEDFEAFVKLVAKNVPLAGRPEMDERIKRSWKTIPEHLSQKMDGVYHSLNRAWERESERDLTNFEREPLTPVSVEEISSSIVELFKKLSGKNIQE